MSAARLVTRRGLAATAHARWCEAYKRSARDRFAVIGEAIAALGPCPNPDDVDAAIGNDSWTNPGACDGCHVRDGQPRVEVGELPDYESATARLCLTCAVEAMTVLQDEL
jgi:CxxC motif-containing protein (DUF1111 family)